MVFSITFKNISVISWRSDLLLTNQYDKTSVMIYHVIADSINTTLIVQINMTKQV
jgi:hypothetical protein